MNFWVQKLAEEARLTDTGQTVLTTDDGDVVIALFYESSNSALMVEYHPGNKPSTYIQAFQATKAQLIDDLRQSFAGYFVVRDGLGLPIKNEHLEG